MVATVAVAAVALAVVVVVVVVAAAAATAAVVDTQFCRCTHHEDTGASERIDSLFVKVGTRWIQCSASRLTHFTLTTETQYAMNKRLRT